MCGKDEGHLQKINLEYRTEEIQSLCGECASLLNDHLWELKKVFAKTVKCSIKRWMVVRKMNKAKKLNKSAE